MPLTGKIRVTKGLDSSHKVLDHACKSKNPFERIDVGEFDSWKDSQPTKLEKDLEDCIHSFVITAILLD